MNICQKTDHKLVASNIVKVFQDVLVVDNVSIHLDEGEFVTLLGPSGSGKSTLFNIISGLLCPDSGEVLIDGENYTGRTGRISYMHQKDLLLPWMRVVDNVALPLLVRGVRPDRAREIAKEYFPIFELEGFEEKYPFQLSGGMRQRAAFMRTYLFSRDIMLLDEPFGGLDAITRLKMQLWLMEVLGRLKVSVLMITHDIEEAIFLSDKIYVLTERPARHKEEIAVRLPKPRERSLTTTVEFNEIKRKILQLLED